MVTDERLRQEFSERLNAACKKAGVRARGRAVDIQQELKRRKLLVSTTAVGKWLNGEAVPGLAHMHALAEYLGTSPAALHYGEPETGLGQQKISPPIPLEGYAKLIFEESLKPESGARLPMALSVLNGTAKLPFQSNAPTQDDIDQIMAQSFRDFDLNAYYQEQDDRKAEAMKSKLLGSFERRMEERRQHARRRDDDPGKVASGSKN